MPFLLIYCESEAILSKEGLVPINRAGVFKSGTFSSPVTVFSEVNTEISVEYRTGSPSFI